MTAPLLLHQICGQIRKRGNRPNAAAVKKPEDSIEASTDRSSSGGEAQNVDRGIVLAAVSWLHVDM
jgi:hypothetical protein